MVTQFAENQASTENIVLASINTDGQDGDNLNAMEPGMVVVRNENEFEEVLKLRL